MRARLCAVLACVGVVAALGVGATPAGSNVGPSIAPPTSMAAVGDSVSRGFATGGGTCNFFGACPEYSWSTGTSVNSHYQRLLALNPSLAGNATNAAVPGSQMISLVGQMSSIAPLQPDYVTVLLGGGDICFGTTTPSQFATRFRAGMDALFATSPGSHVLVASIWNLESQRSAVLAGNPSATWSFCGGFFNASAVDRATIMNRLQQYNAVLETECATYINCLFDGYALYNHVWTFAEVSAIDNVHPSIAGQEMLSETLFNAGYTWGVQPTNADECKDDGWEDLVDAAGASFQNQGDCVSYVATDGRNPASN